MAIEFKHQALWTCTDGTVFTSEDAAYKYEAYYRLEQFVDKNLRDAASYQSFDIVEVLNDNQRELLNILIAITTRPANNGVSTGIEVNPMDRVTKEELLAQLLHATGTMNGPDEAYEWVVEHGLHNNWG